jgi:hypothetical protein
MTSCYGADGENDNDDAEKSAIRPGAAKGTGSGPVLGQDEGGGNGKGDEQVDWTSFVPGVRRVLAMSVSTTSTSRINILPLMPSYFAYPSAFAGRSHRRISHTSYPPSVPTIYIVSGARRGMEVCRRWRVLMDVPGRKRMIISIRFCIYHMQQNQ